LFQLQNLEKKSKKKWEKEVRRQRRGKILNTSGRRDTLTFLLGTHERVGSESPVNLLDRELLREIATQFLRSGPKHFILCLVVTVLA